MIAYIFFSRFFFAHIAYNLPLQSGNAEVITTLFLRSLVAFRQVSKRGMRTPKLDEAFHFMMELLFGPTYSIGTGWVEGFNKTVGDMYKLNSRQDQSYLSQLQEQILLHDVREEDRLQNRSLSSIDQLGAVLLLCCALCTLWWG